MKILLVAEVSITQVNSGAERVLREQAVGLAARGHEVRILTRMGTDGEPARIVVGEISETRYAVSRRNAVSFVLSTLQNAKRAWASLVREDPPDVIVVHQALPGLAILHRSVKTPLAYMCLSLAHEEFEARNSSPANIWGWIWYYCHSRARQWTERTVMRRARRIIVLSDFIRKSVETCHRVAGDRIRIIPGGADVGRFSPVPDHKSVRAALGLREKEFVLFTLRNLEPRMGLQALIQAMALARRTIPHLRLLIGGSGLLQPMLEALVKTMGLEDCVRLLGFIPEALLPDYYRAADLFVLPTTRLEGFGLVTIEALASGTPVFGTRVGATDEILRNLDPALLSERTDPESMAAGISALYRRFLADSNARPRLAEAGRALVLRDYTWARHCERVEEVLVEACGSQQEAHR